MKECVAVRHLQFEDLGYFEELLSGAGYRVRYVDAPQASLTEIRGLSPDLLIVLGAPVGANDEQDYPFLAAELDLLARRISANRPTLGICLGGQLMARAMGAVVAPGLKSEVGWAPLVLTASGMKSPLRHLDNIPVLHWHNDAFDLPEHGVPLASTPDCPHQAFSCGPNLLGLQFHPEVTAEGLESWYVGHYRGINASAGVTVERLRNDAAQFARALRERGSRMLQEWLEQLRY